MIVGLLGHAISALVGGGLGTITHAVTGYLHDRNHVRLLTKLAKDREVAELQVASYGVPRSVQLVHSAFAVFLAVAAVAAMMLNAVPDDVEQVLCGWAGYGVAWSFGLSAMPSSKD